MNLSFQHLLPEDFSPYSRVWIYQSSRFFSIGEALELEPMLEEFVANWKAHGSPVNGYANLFFGQFIVLIADETEVAVSGCSTDSSVRFIKSIEERFRVTLFDRQQLAFVVKDKVQLLPMSQLPWAVENKFITPDTLYFNNLVPTKDQLEKDWIIPAKESWLARRFPILASTV